MSNLGWTNFVGTIWWEQFSRKNLSKQLDKTLVLTILLEQFCQKYSLFALPILAAIPHENVRVN